MPEIAEVERARLRIHRQCLNLEIIHVQTQPDTLVFKDIDPDEFSQKVLGRILVDTKRWGKYFVLLFDKGPSMVAHFGMTGGIRFQHEEKTEDWPPKFWKLLITFQDPNDKDKTIQFAFKDPRRLARLRLVEGRDPLLEDPIKKLGFDPVLSLPPADIFYQLVLRRAVPVKALLLDQSFSAGVGNWVADEVLYQAHIHPAQYTNTLTKDELVALYEKLKFVCETAVKKEADESKFPEDWLMTYRWNKGKKTGQKLPNGLSLKFETVGGRTSAFAPFRQILRKSAIKKRAIVKKAAAAKQDIPAKLEATVKQETAVKQEDLKLHLRRSPRSLTYK